MSDTDDKRWAPDAYLHEFVYFNKDDFPNATGRTIWTCGQYYFLVSSIINEEMDASETMVFQCNSIGVKTNGSQDLAFCNDPYPEVSMVKELVQSAYRTLHEDKLRESIEHFVRYEATPDQLQSIKTMHMTPRVFD
tara:strand:- start:12043 stop:12450 length:408 start_codon:yes stop_codon:yes gene_type:complete